MANREHIHFVTGRLAESSLREIVAALADEARFNWSIEVLPITVAALMSTKWVAERLAPPAEATKILLPGYCSGDLQPVEQSARLPVERGPKDLHELPDFFGAPSLPSDYGNYDIEILAEINHCPRLSLTAILAEAASLRSDGADWIDVGCEPGETWTGVADVVRALVAEGHRVSIDSLNPLEIDAAVAAGAELVLSVTSANRRHAPDWGAEVVVIPDDPGSLAGFSETIEFLDARGVPMRVDPVLEPIGFGFAASLERYRRTRQQYPHLPMLMGIGNLTELTDADSAAINVLLLGICQELGIGSVLTTQVIPWARSSVRECDLARRLVHFSVTHHALPKHAEPRLVLLRDERTTSMTTAEIEMLASSLRDNNFRIFAADGEVHLVSRDLHLHHEDPFLLMEQLLRAGPDGQPPRNLDAGHAFYLGYECCKARTALTLNKQYRQDEALDWGFLTRPEPHHRLASHHQRSGRRQRPQAGGDG